MTNRQCDAKAVEPCRQMRHRDDDALRFMKFDRGYIGVEDRFLDVKHSPLFGKASHEMLRSLKHEIPSQMRETEKIVVVFFAVPGALVCTIIKIRHRVLSSHDDFNICA